MNPIAKIIVDLSNAPPSDQVSGLVQKLKAYPIEEVYSWLPMLVHIQCMTNSETLNSYLDEVATSNIDGYLRVRWCISAYQK